MEVTKPGQQLSMRVGLFFDEYRDQRNIVSLVRMPGGERASIYFAPDDEKEALVKW